MLKTPNIINELLDATKFYGTSVIGTKGQMVIPNEVRKLFNINPKDKVVVLGAPGGIMVIIKINRIEKLLKGVLRQQEA